MASYPSTHESLVMAHVLFIDMVGFSKLPIDHAKVVLTKFQQTVQKTRGYLRAKTRNEVIFRPAGDGGALVFMGNPEAPVRCAIELNKEFRTDSNMKVRMGVHSGPVCIIEGSLNTGDQDVLGDGINMAQRVMSCGDSNHILLSSITANLLSHVSNKWSGFLHDLGETEVKHGVKVRLFNLYSADIGNSDLPAALRKTASTSTSNEQKKADTAIGELVDQKEGDRQSVAAAPECPRVVLLYKRNVALDEQLLRLLEAKLAAEGCQVFIDRYLQIGMHWAKDIKQHIASADVVIPLISAASVQSEMLGYEIQLAHEYAQKQAGKPRILPIRINFEQPLPDPFAAILDGIQYATWSGPSEDQSLLNELLGAVRRPGAFVPQPPKLEPVGGAVPLDSRFYIVRSTDEEFLTAICRQDSIVLIKGARQMGKTSLMARGLQLARQNGDRVVLTDFQKLNTKYLESTDAFLRALAESIADQLDCDLDIDSWWNPKRGASTNFERFLRRGMLPKVTERFVWGMDEVDRLFSCAFASEVFGLFRSWHNERSLDPGGPWQKLTMAIAYATEAHMFITDMNQSPFNVGTRLTLADFTLKEFAELNERYGHPLKDASEIAACFKLLGGHPYLTRRGLNEMASRAIDFRTFEAQSSRDEGPLGDHLRRILFSLAQDPALCEVVRALVGGRRVAATEQFYRLRSAGIVAGDSAREMHPRCQLYQQYLSRHLL